MTQKELEQKVIDAEGRVAKREAVLKKHNSQLAKMIEKGADRFDVSIKREDIKSATSKLAEARETLANWQDSPHFVLLDAVDGGPVQDQVEHPVTPVLHQVGLRHTAAEGHDVDLLTGEGFVFFHGAAPFRKAERAGARPALHLLHDDDLAGVDQIAHVLQEVVGDVLLGLELPDASVSLEEADPLVGIHAQQELALGLLHLEEGAERPQHDAGP